MSLRIPLLLSLLPLAWGMDEPALEQLQLWDKNPDACNRAALLQYLRHQDIKVRSAALDLLESVTGKDFGLDPWLAPQEAPAPVQQALEEWVHAGDSLGSAGQAPTPGQLREAMALLRTADPDTQRRICLRFSRFRASFTAALQQELEKPKNQPGGLTDKERDRLRCAQFRAQLQGGGVADAGQAATKLTSHARADILEGLEQLRKAGKEALPVLMQFVSRPNDALVREVAVDVLMELGGLQAFHALQPMLMAEDDRNILQIAARRAIDCQADPALVAFLGKCVLSSDEDIAIAGLEALGAISADREEDVDEEGPSSPSLSQIPCALEPAQYIALLQSPHWRVRAAALAALRSTVPLLPSLYDAKLQDALLACLQDEDETVRQTAMEVIYKRKLTRLRGSDLEAFALRTPSHAAFVIYQFCESDIRLTPALLELPSRFDARQVEQLAAYDDEGRSVFTTNSPSHDALAVLGKLMQNPDPRVRRSLMQWCGPYLYSFREEWAEAYKEWLMDAHLPEPDKGESLSDLLRHLRYDRRKSVERARDDAALNGWLQQEMNRPSADKDCAHAAYALLLFLHPQEFLPMAAEKLPQLDSRTLEWLAESQPKAFLQLDAASLSRLLNEHRDLADELLSELGHDAQGTELLSRLELNDAAWSALFNGHSRLILRDFDNESSWIYPLLCRTMESAPSPRRRQEAAYLYLLCRHNLAHAFRQSGKDVPPEPAALHDAIQSAPPAQAEALECMRRAPFQTEEIEPWARQFASSKDAHVRCAVASCLLPLDGWLFCLPPTAQQDAGFYALPPMKGRNNLQRTSCPASLIALVRGMQQDADPAVALMACASILYRTGDCDRARMADLLSRFKKQMDEAQGADDGEPALMPLKAQYQALGQVWRRWFRYRKSTDEPFKLKGNPRKLKPGVVPLLQQLQAINDESWGVDDALTQQLGNRLSAGNAQARQLMPHEFHFSQPQGNDASPTPPPPASPSPSPLADGADATDGDEEDAPEPQPLDITAPVRLEFFHQKGCDICSRVKKRLADMQEAYPGLHVVDYDIASPEGFERNDVLSQRFGIPHRDRHKAPALFAEGGYLLGEDAAGDALQRLLENSLARGQEGKRLADSPSLPEPQAPSPKPTESSPTPPSGMLAAATADEKQQAQAAQTGEKLRSYGLLAIGAATVLASLALLLFGHKKKEEPPQE